MQPQIDLSVVLPVPREVLYRAWLDGNEHAAFTGAGASSDPRVGGMFTAWDGYISGVTEELDAHVRIVQSWRTTAFPADAEDSELELVFEDVPEGTRLLVRQWNVPPDQVQSYTDGWRKHYFEPMLRYFTSGRAAAPKAKPARAPLVSAVKVMTGKPRPKPQKKKPKPPARKKAKAAAKPKAPRRKKPAARKAARAKARKRR
jgi:uncharacterized protein YndB with AHSA1/START domain